MSIIIFIIMLAVLIFVHELGHLIVAKAVKMRVDEFGIGFPPKAVTLFKKGGTEYSLNWIPFGGFVRIFGENPDEESISGDGSERSFTNKKAWQQAVVLIAGVSFNIIFAWLLISIGFMSGLPAPVNYSGMGTVENAALTVTSVMADSPAHTAGLKVGDHIEKLSTTTDELSDPQTGTLQEFIKTHGDTTITFDISRGSEKSTVMIHPEKGVISGGPAIGIAMDEIGTLQLNFFQAFWEGAKMTVTVTEATVVGLATFFGHIFTGTANLSQVTGPVGIVGLVGDASALGLVYILSFAAFISINLAVINLLPFPALDGGRLLFVLIEKIKGSRISPRVANTLNGIGFLLLILLMVVITVHDVIKLF